MSRAYYNEVEPYAVQWLRNLIDAHLIAGGDVDTRSIEDVTANDLAGYTQCHFFAGLGGWSVALRLAGWPDDRSVWTGSCPCQPFSTAGKGGGFADERHLWPAWEWLIGQRKPRVIFGEQVASPAGRAWLDLVSTDLEGSGYAVGPVVLPAAGVGAPHERHRLWWVADADGRRLEIRAQRDGESEVHAPDGRACGAHADRHGGPSTRSVGHAHDPRSQGRQQRGHGADQCAVGATGVVGGFWSDAEWLPCLDGKLRPVEPGTLKVVDGISQSLGRLRADAVEAITQEIASYAAETRTDVRKALLDLWMSLRAETLQPTSRGPNSVSDAPVLLAFMRQLTEQRWAFAESLSRACSETPEGALRSLQRDAPVACTPRQRGLDGQQTREHSDSMRVLSSILARHAQEAWGEAFNAHAGTFPLAHGVPNRVGRLRAYGNAIVPEVAAEVIGAYLECCS